MGILAPPARSRFPVVTVEAVPACEFVVSLCAFSQRKGQETFDLGRGWFDAIRRRVAPDLLESIELYGPREGVIVLWHHLLDLAYATPAPRDVPAFLAHVRATDPVALRRHLLGYHVAPLHHPGRVSDEQIAAAAAGDGAALTALLAALFPGDRARRVRLAQVLGEAPEATKVALLDVLERWYGDVFAPLEADILPILARDAARLRERQQQLSPEQVLTLALPGVRVEPEAGLDRVALVPSYLMRPWILYSQEGDRRLYCYPVADESLAAEEIVPPARLVRLGKALGDERRLRILKLLAGESLTLQEVATILGVGKTTVHYHFGILRAAGLIEEQARRGRLRGQPGPDKPYRLRRDQVPEIAQLLAAYLGTTDR